MTEVKIWRKLKVRQIEQVYAFDIDHYQAERFAEELAGGTAP